MLPYDLFLGIPVHCAPEVVVASELVEDGWIPVDPATFATRFPNVFAVGDVTSAPVPHAGGIAEGEAATVAEVLISKFTDDSDPLPYDGAAGCYVELGDDLVGRIDVNFLSYDTPVAKFTAPNAALRRRSVNRSPPGSIGGSAQGFPDRGRTPASRSQPEWERVRPLGCKGARICAAHRSDPILTNNETPPVSHEP